MASISDQWSTNSCSMKCWNLKNHYVIQIQGILLGVPAWLLLCGIIIVLPTVLDSWLRQMCGHDVDTDTQIIITHNYCISYTSCMYNQGHMADQTGS